jgi:serine-type D-Ala-D-Ala carboxypeptidase/endopeptidase
VTERLQAAITEVVGQPKGGLAVGAAARGEEAFAGFGEARPGGPAVAADTIFEIGSITKVFTGILLASLVLDGAVALDDRLSRHLPDARIGSDPTLRDLATHRSGLANVPRGLGWREMGFVLGFPGVRNPHEGLTRAEFERAAGRMRVARRRFRYSSVGFGLLGEALGRAAGAPYEDVLGERVLAPLALADTAVDPGSLRRLAAGTSRRGRLRPPFEDPFLVPAGGLRSTARDMTRFLRAQLDPGSIPIGPALGLAQQPHSRVNWRISIGLGWLIERRRGRVLHWHNGGTWGFRSFAGFESAAARAVVLLSNRSRMVDRAALKLLERL